MEVHCGMGLTRPTSPPRVQFEKRLACADRNGIQQLGQIDFTGALDGIAAARHAHQRAGAGAGKRGASQRDKQT